MNVLVVAPHPDDEAIGCGGMIAHHVQLGDRVQVTFLTSGELCSKHRPADEVRALREKEAQAAAAVLGTAECAFLRRPDWGLDDDLEATGAALSAVVQRFAPERIYAPHAHEWHPDHRAAHTAACRAAAAQGLPPECVLGYEVWTPLREYTVVEDVSEHIGRKLEAIRCYESQLETFDYVQAAAGLSSFRGALAAHSAHAEVFEQPPNGTPWPR